MIYALLEILCDLTLSWNCSHTIEIASHAKLVSSVTSIFARNLAQGGIFCRLCFVAWAIIISLFKIFIRRRYNINSIGEIMSALPVSVICTLWKVIQDSFSKHLQVKYTKYHKRHSLLMYNLRQKNMKWGSEKLKPSLIEMGLAVRFLKCKHSLY